MSVIVKLYVLVCVLCTFGLSGRAVWVTQCQQGHLDQLVEQQISLDQHKLSMFFSPLSLHEALRLLHHTEHRQKVSWSDGQQTILCSMTFEETSVKAGNAD